MYLANQRHLSMFSKRECCTWIEPIHPCSTPMPQSFELSVACPLQRTGADLLRHSLEISAGSSEPSLRRNTAQSHHDRSRRIPGLSTDLIAPASQNHRTAIRSKHPPAQQHFAGLPKEPDEQPPQKPTKSRQRSHSVRTAAPAS
jgi:hypothetical protein